MEFNANNPGVAGEFARMLSSADIKRGLTRKLRRICSRGPRPATVFVVDTSLITPCLWAVSQDTADAISIYLQVVQEQLFDNLRGKCATVDALMALGVARKASEFWRLSRREYRAEWEGLFFTPDTLEALIEQVGAKEVTHYLAFYSEMLYSRTKDLRARIMADWNMFGHANVPEADFASGITEITNAQHCLWEDVKDTYLRSKEAWLTKKKG